MLVHRGGVNHVNRACPSHWEIANRGQRVDMTNFYICCIPFTFRFLFTPPRST
jgi:hypothetical protein